MSILLPSSSQRLSMYVIAGLRDMWMQMRQCKDVKIGELVGVDEHGNRYYENKLEQCGKDRYVNTPFTYT